MVRGRRGEEEKTFNNYLERFLGGGLAKSVIDASIGLLFVRLHCYRFTLVRMPLLFFPRLSSLIAVVFSCFLFFHLVFIPSNVLIFFHGLNVSVSVVFSVHLNTPSSAASRRLSLHYISMLFCASLLHPPPSVLSLHVFTSLWRYWTRELSSLPPPALPMPSLHHMKSEIKSFLFLRFFLFLFFESVHFTAHSN